jgi:hypothetical protein
MGDIEITVPGEGRGNSTITDERGVGDANLISRRETNLQTVFLLEGEIFPSHTEAHVIRLRPSRVMARVFFGIWRGGRPLLTRRQFAKNPQEGSGLGHRLGGKQWPFGQAVRQWLWW